jgi:hypothetical protein
MAGFQLSINGRFWVSTEVDAARVIVLRHILMEMASQ